ncbi:glutathione S-transferase family protein [Acidisoma silvae]|uniref:Glutathione S-transferase n=1 Tax=Acidisoma silvae TaxID=2802396 RepID=A0A963YW14_9PROT|nr:glutathione S-transferase family protein [Acidisoma silvae]MCB8877900.1 glutathione S-transferase [Acidisoma silvae]
MSRYRLHYFPESGNSYKLALMLTLCGESFEPVWTDFGSRVTWTQKWREQINPMGEIPVLEEDGDKLTQTGPILLSLAEQTGLFQGRDQSERFEVLRWLFWDNQKLSGFMASYRFLRTFSFDAEPAVLSWQRRRVDDFLSILERRVDQIPFIIGDIPTIADLSASAYLSFPQDETGYDYSTTHPEIFSWLGRLRDLPGWRAPYDLLPGKRLRRYT